MIKKVIIVFSLSLLHFACIYSQTEIDTVCRQNIKNIFKVHDLEIKYKTVKFIYKYKESGFFKNDSFLNSSFLLIKGFPHWEKQKDSISGVKPGELVKVEFLSKEEMNRYIEQLDYTPEEARKEYEDFVRNIQLEKEMYLKCIDAELVKGDVSEYAKDNFFYSFHEPWSSLLPPRIKMLDFLNVFKEFILNNNEEVLPDFSRAKASLKYSQTEVDTVCKRNLETIFKVRDFKVKYELVQYIYKEGRQRRSHLFTKNNSMLNHYFVLIKGFPLYPKEQRDPISDVDPEELKPVPVEWMSEEEVNRFFEQFNYTPEDAYKEYCSLIQNIKLEKEIYLKCIDTEIVKGGVSEYAKDLLHYDLMDPMSSISPPRMTKLDFLKIFKEFVINDDEKVLPEIFRAKAYLKCGCKMFPYQLLFLNI